MSERKHNELIDYIRKSLPKHEEPYSPGAWEAFQQRRKRKSRMIVGKVVLGAAASLALVLSVMFVLKDFTDPAHKQTIAEQREVKRDTSSTGKPDSRPRTIGPASEFKDS